MSNPKDQKKTGPAAKLGGAAQRKELLKELGESENGREIKGLSLDMDARREAQENAGRFSTYMRKQYDQRRREREMSAAAKKEEDFSEQIRQNRDKIEAARKEMLDKQREIREAAEGRERDFRIDLEWREKELEKKLAEMGSDEYKLTPYDPEKARAVFAEALAVREMRDRRAKGEKPGPVDLQTRMQELGKDGTVARMAATLPGDASFRALLAQRPEKNASRLPAVTEALEKARQSFAKGRQLSECYMEQRENARKLAGGIGGEKLTPKQAARLAANLIAVRELETAAGGRDAPVDESAWSSASGSWSRSRSSSRRGRISFSPGIRLF